MTDKRKKLARALMEKTGMSYQAALDVLADGSAAPSLACIYCHEPLERDTVQAHVIPQCLGGRLSSKQICCTGCNNAISPLERDLCDALRNCGAMLRARDADNRPIRARIEAGGKIYDYADGLGDEVLPDPVFKDGKLVFPIPGAPDDVVDVLALHLWRAHLPTAALFDGRVVVEPDQTFNVRPHPPAQKMLFSELKLGTVEHMRVVMKMALELLAYLRPTEARRWDALRPARRLVRWGEAAPTLPVKFESLSRGAGLFRPDEMPQLAHAVEIWTHGQHLSYRVTFFGGLHVTGPLSTRWDGAPLSLAHALDPREPRRAVSKETASDGPALGLYHPGLKKEALDKFGEWIMAKTLEISADVLSQQWQAPRRPDLTALRPAIEEKLAALLKRKKQPKKPKRER